MPFDLDESNPTDSYVVSQYPANARASRAATLGSIAVEHDAEDSGRHTFGVGSSTSRDAITDWPVGAVWMNTSRSSGKTLLDICTSIGPVVWYETDIIGLAEANTWTMAQQTQFLALGTSGSGPMSLTWDPTARNAFKHTLTEDSQMANPSPSVTANDFSTWVFEITQNGAGGHALTFASNWTADGGAQPTISAVANAVSFVRAHAASDGSIIYQVAPG